MKTALQSIAITAGVLLLDACVVFGAFAGSRLLLPWLSKAGPIVMVVSVALLPLLIPKKIRKFSAPALLACSIFFWLSFIALSFVTEADLGGMFGLIIGLATFGTLVPPLAVVTAVLQGQWTALGELLAVLAMALVSYGLAGWSMTD